MKGTISSGLEGVIALQSRISSINGLTGKLIYRGYDIRELARHADFEEIVYLLWFNALPTKGQLTKFRRELRSGRLPKHAVDLIKTARRTTDPMSVLRSAVSSLALKDKNESDNGLKENLKKAKALVLQIPLITAAIHRVRNNKKVINPSSQLSVAGNFLYALTGKKPDRLSEKTFDTCLLLHAEHGLNASTFAARVTVATLSDMYSGMTSAIGTLKGPLHGGANQKAFQQCKSVNVEKNAESFVIRSLKKHQRIMGIGHRVYKVKDPRATILESYAKTMCNREKKPYYAINKKIEQVIAREKHLYPNVDFFSGIVYAGLGIPTILFPCVFACGRSAGWIAHMLEQYEHNRLIRPRAEYIGERNKAYVPLGKR